MNPIFIKIFFGFVSLFILAGCGSSSSTSAINLTDEFWGVAVDDPNNSTQLYISNFTKGGLGSVPIASGATGGTVTSMTTSTSGFYGPEGMVVVGADLYLVEALNHLVRKVSTVAPYAASIHVGTGVSGNSDASGTFNFPRNVVADVNGNLYVTDSHNRSVRRIDAVTQAVSTIVATDLDNPWGITIDNAVPQNLYVTDIGTHSVKKLTETAVGSGVWNVSVFAGNGVIGTASSTPVIGNAARFNSPVGITIDHTYTYLYVADSGNNAIRRIKLANAEVEVIAGVGTAGNADNATGTSATFSTPLAITYAFYNATAEGVLFVTDQSGTTIRQVSTSAPYGVTSFGLN